jgi:hypothetical protein
MFLMIKNLCLLCCATSGLPMGEAIANSPARLAGSCTDSRIVKEFDFDEAQHGNFESTPMNWRPRRSPGYPRFLEAQFDAESGHDAPPSFRFSLETGSMASDFLAREIAVQAKADYELSAWIRPACLTHARAYISACFLDDDMHEIAESRQASDAVRGAGRENPWTRVRVVLTGNYPTARWISLTCHAEQAEVNPTAQSGVRAIHHHDVRATAWFDDVRVVRLPRLELDISAAGNVFEPAQPLRCRARVADVDGEGLTNSLSVVDVDGNELWKRAIPTRGIHSVAAPYNLGPLDPGYYTLRLTADAAQSTIAMQERAFVVLGPIAATSKNRGKGFGLVLDEDSLAHAAEASRLSELSGSKLVKAPLWRESLTDEEVLQGHDGTNHLLNSLRSCGISIAATMDGVPAGLKKKSGPENLVELLRAAGEPWRAHLALVFVRYGAQVQAWQFGGEAGLPAEDHAQQAEALERARVELNELIGTPTLIVPTPAVNVDRSSNSRGDIASVTVGDEIQLDQIDAHLKAATGRGGRCWATVIPPNRDEFQWHARIAETARRMILSRIAGAEEVLIPQPWRILDEGSATRVEPDATFSAFRTIASVLGGLKPAGPCWLGPDIAGWLFEDEQSGRGVLAAWQTGDANDPTTITVDADSSARQIDVWGRSSAPRKMPDGLQVNVDVCPTLVAPVDMGRMKTLAGFSVSPATLPLCMELQTCEISLTNARQNKLKGTLKLSGPAGWMLTPSRLSVDLTPGQSMRESIRIRLPSNQSTGRQSLVGKLKLDGSEKESLTMRAPVTVGTSELAVRLLARIEYGRVHVSARITNLSDREMTVRTILIAGSREPEGRLISNFAAGATTSRDYVINNARELKGRYLRLCVEEVGGAARDNQVLKIE